MQLLVTGASGFVGLHLVESLARVGHRGYAISRNPGSAALPAYWEWKARSKVLAHGPPISVESGRARVDAVIHLEVKHHVPNPSAREAEDFSIVNEGNTVEWLNWMDHYDLRRFVLFSSIKATGSAPECQNESGLRQPESEYGRSKLAAEAAVLRWAQLKPERSALILRPAVVYGPRNIANLYAFVRAIEQRRFWFVGKNNNVKSVVSVRNLCAAVQHLLERMQPGCEIFNVVDQRNYSVRELAGMIASALDVKLRAWSIPLPMGWILASLGDMAVRCTGVRLPLTTPRLRALLESSEFSCTKLLGTGFKHPQTTMQGLEELVRWHQSLRKTAGSTSGGRR